VRVLCAGHVNWDVTLGVDQLPEPDGEARILEQHQSGGGSAANAATVFATLDVQTGVLGSVGTDQYGAQARRELVDAGVDVSFLVETGVGTATKYLVVDPDGRLMVLGRDQGNEAFHADDVPRDVVRSVEHVHMTGQRAATAAELATTARSADVPVSVDPGRLAGRRGLGEVLDCADYRFLTDEEARTVGFDPDDADDRPSSGVVVVKRGSEGAEVRTPETVYQHPGYEIDPVDTTGAGDAFAAGFVTALLEDWDPRPGSGGDFDSDATPGAEHPSTGIDVDFDRALAVANACGALAAHRTGARAHVSRTDVERFLAVRDQNQDRA